MKLYVVPTGGLANRLRAIAAGYALAKKTGRELIVLWHKDNGLNARFEELFTPDSSKFKIINVSDFKYQWLYDLPRKKNLYLSGLLQKVDSREWLIHSGENAAQMDDLYFEKKALESGKDILVMSCYAFYYNTPEILKEILIPTEAVEARIREITKGKNIKTAVQIRRTDHTWSIDNSPLELFEHNIEE